MQWSRWYDTGGYDKAWSGQYTSDGGFVLAGECDNHSDVLVVKTDRVGDTLWVRAYDWAGADEMAYSIRQVPDSGFILAGYTTSHLPHPEMLIVRLAANGDTCWSRLIGGIGSELASAVRPTADGGYIVAGTTDSYGAGNDDVYVVKLGSDAMSRTQRAAAVASRFVLSAYPDPFNPTTTLSFTLPHTARTTVTVFDVSGREVKRLCDQVYEAGEQRISFDGSSLPSGIYFARLQAGGFTATQKLVLLK